MPARPCSPDPIFLTAPEVAELLRLPSTSTLYQWRHRGEGPPARRVGKRLLYRRSEVLDWADAQAS